MHHKKKIIIIIINEKKSEQIQKPRYHLIGLRYHSLTWEILFKCSPLRFNIMHRGHPHQTKSFNSNAF